MKYKILLLFVGLFYFNISIGQPITVINSLTAEQLVQDTLISGCVTAFNISFTGASSMIGYFNSTGSSFDSIMSSGIVLASGPVTNAIGPNNSGSISQGMGLPGDIDLNALIPQSTNDAAVLQFDFVPSSDTLQFKYVFGSDEYLEYVNSSFNDIFAFFLSGPNPAGGSYVNTNIAIVPGTATPVSINNVNNASYSQYYINNGTGSTPSPSQALQYDGYTIGMFAVALVVPCETYHIKLAVADAGDSALDSGVFIGAGSFTDGTSVTINNVNPAGTLNDLYEGCESFYVFTRQDTTNLSFPVDIQLAFSGTAIIGSDITTFPTLITIPIGQMSDTVFYTAIMDGLQETTETFIIEVLAGCPCNPEPAVDTITIYDYVEFKAGIINTDSMFCGITPPATYTIVSTCVSHPAWFITYLWNTGSTDSSITVVPPLPGNNDVYWVRISDLCGNDIIDSITVGVSHLSGLTVSSTNALCYQFCNGTVQATPLGTAGGLDFVWSNPNLGITTSGNLNGLCAGNYTVTVTDDSYCAFHQNFTIGQPNAALSTSSGILPIDTSYCTDPGNLTLNAFANIPNVTYSWNSSSPGPNILTVNPAYGLNTYWVKISDYCGFAVYDTVKVYVSNVQNSNVDVDNTSCYGVCDGAVIVQTDGIPPFEYQWGSNNSGSFTSTFNSLDSLCIDTFYLNVVDAIGCEFSYDFYVEQPDSFNSALSGINVFNTTWCGTLPPPVITLEGYSNLFDVNYLWSNGSTNQNLFITPVSGSTFYTVTISDNCGNSKVDQVNIVVSNMSGLTAFTDTATCYNSCDGYVSIVPQGGISPFTYNWSPGIGTPTSGTINNLCQGSYSVTVTDYGGCEFIKDFTINGPSPLNECKITNGQTMFCGISAPSSILLNTWVNSDVDYVWSTGATTPQITIVPLTGANIFWVDFYDQCGNVSRDSIIISVSNLSGALVSTDNALCYSSCDGQVEVTPLGGISPYTYFWDIPGVPSGSANIIPDICAGSFEVIVKDLALCAITKQFTIQQPDSVTFQFISSESDGDDCNGFASAINVDGGTPPYTYLWDDNNNTTTYNVAGLCPGLYTVIINDSHNCSYSDTIRVEDSTVGIDDIENSDNLNIYPNPNSTGVFLINTTDTDHYINYIELFDATGKLLSVLDKFVENESIIIKNVPAGVSLLRIILDDGTIVMRKLVVTK